MGGVRYFGAAEEATFGTKQTTDALFNYVDAAEVNLDVPKDSILSYVGVTHRSPTVVAKGQYIPEGDINQAVEGEFAAWFLKWVLGDYVNCLQFDGGKEAYRHTFKTGNTLKSFTARVGKEVMEQVFEGCKIGSLGVEIPKNDFAMMKASIVAQQDSAGTLKAETAIDTHETGFFSFCHGSLEIDSTPTAVDSVSFELNNNISADAGVRIGSRFPQAFDVNAQEIPITLELPFDAVTHFTNFWGNASTPTTLTSKSCTVALTSDDDTIDGTNYYAMEFTFPRCYYKSIGQPLKGRDEMKQSIELQAFYDETSGYAVQVTVDTGIYAYALECFFRCVHARNANLVLAGGTRGLIHKTADAGATTWTNPTSGLSAWTDRINRIEFVSDTVAYAVGMDGVVLKTIDAGATWSDVSTTVTNDWYGLFAIDATTLYICGSGGAIYYSADSGSTWAAKTSGITTALYSITGISDEYVAVGAAGKILNSSDGTTWAVRTSGVTVDLMCVTAYEGTPDIWIAVGETGTVLTSADATTWADKSIAGVTATLRGVDCTSEIVAAVVGDSDTCYYTGNAGTAWTEKDPGTTNVSFYGITMVSGTNWFIAGTFEAILKTTDTGATWTTQTV
jgi:hypothetical protein